MKIKSTLVVLTILLMFPFAANAWDIHYGISGGLNLAKITSDYNEDLARYGVDLNRKTGMSFGAYLRLNMNDKLAVQPEIRFSQLGMKGLSTLIMYGIPFTIKMDIKLNYFQVPIFIMYQYLLKKFNINLVAGPYIGMNTGANAKVTLEALGEKEENTEKLTDIKKTDFGIAFGVGIEHQLGPGKLGVASRFYIGMTSIADDSDAKNSNISMIFSYTF